MTHAERREQSAIYQRGIKRFQKKYAPQIQHALKLQIDHFIYELRKYGVESAKKHINQTVINQDVSKVIREMYIDIGKWQFIRMKRMIKSGARKKGIADFGYNEELTATLIDFLRNYLLDDAVLPITETTKQQILRVLEQGIGEGWGIDKIVSELEAPELTRWRAEMIVRTESQKAAFAGNQAAINDTDFILQKEWISAEDDRVREAHQEADGQVVDEDENFEVGGEEMEGPGDPNASAENVINCRCTLGLVPKRDKGGQLIDKNPSQDDEEG